MCKEEFLIALNHPFSAAPYIFIKKNKDVEVYRNCAGLDSSKTYISYEFSSLIDKFRAEQKMTLPETVDIQTAKKLLSGKKKSEFSPGNQPWILKNILGNNVNAESLKWLAKFSQLKMAPKEIDSEIKIVAFDIMNGIEKAWTKIKEDLKSTNNHERFWDVENVLYNYFLNTQLKGVNVPQDALTNMLNDLYRLHYQSVKKLELTYGFVFNPLELNSEIKFQSIEKFISSGNIVKEDFDYNFWESVELYRECDDFLMTLFTAHKSMRDRNALLRYVVDRYDSIYPKFDIMGTVTGRILITSPGVQYLKKTSRGIFTAREGFYHLYADFDQFEPGIIASFSKDQKLIELYNNGDIYNELSKTLFNSVEKRKLSKIIFLAFMYGMNEDRLKKFIESIAGSAAKEQGASFFNKFQTLCQWKETVCEKAREEGYSSSIKGNQRYLQKKGIINGSEKRWVPNQIIQGTASYIFKKSLISLKQSAPYIDFLIPMHDAILMEVPNSKVEEAKDFIKQVFINEFVQICPGIKANVSFDKFAETE